MIFQTYLHQLDNQVFEAQSPVVLYVTPASRSHSSDPEEAVRPAISFSAERTPTRQPYNADIFRVSLNLAKKLVKFERRFKNLSITLEFSKKSYDRPQHFIVRVKSISLIIDERLLLKLFLFFGWNAPEGNENTDESDFETQRILAEAASVYAKRYYFESLKIIFTQVRYYM